MFYVNPIKILFVSKELWENSLKHIVYVMTYF